MVGHKVRGTEGSRCRHHKERGVLMWAVVDFILFLNFLLHFRLQTAWGVGRFGRGGRLFFVNGYYLGWCLRFVLRIFRVAT